MKQGDIVICIDNKSNGSSYIMKDVPLTIGKSYKVLNESHYMITDGFYNTISIVDDSLVGHCDYRLERFITLQQWRDKQLNKILL